MSYVVTGVSGQLGRLAVESLLARGIEPSSILATARSVEKLSDLAARGVRTARLDYEDRSSVTAALNAGDRVVLVSSNAVGARAAHHATVIDAAREASVAQLVYTSAPKADDTPLILAPDHAATEQALRDSGVPFTVLRNNWYIENYAQSVAQVSATGALLGAAGEGRVASATRAEFADAIAAVLTESDDHLGKTYELAGDQHWTYAELAEAISEVLDRPVTYKDLPVNEYIETLKSFGLDEGTAGFVATLDANIAAGALDVESDDLSRLIGRPTLSLVDQVRTIAS